MNRIVPRVLVIATLFGGLACLAVGCADTAGPEGLNIEVSFAEEVPKSLRDRAERVEVYLIDSCGSIDIPERPDDVLGSTFSLRDGREGPPIEVPEAGEYALYAIARDETCSVVASGCETVPIAEHAVDALLVKMEAASGAACSLGQECNLETGECSDCVDADQDGVCASRDCDDRKPRCASDCTDLDDDGYCADTDCDDTVGTCTEDCTRNSDEDAQVDCFEQFCGSRPNDSSSFCLEVDSEAEYKNAIGIANAIAGRDFLVLRDFTLTSSVPAFDDDAGAIVRQVAGASLRVSSGSNLTVFDLNSDRNWIDGVRVVNVSNAETVVLVKGDYNIVSGCQIEGFDRRGIYVDGGDQAWIFDNVVTGGRDGQGNETAAIILRDTADSIVVGNTVAFNAMDGLQVRKAIAPTIDHNTLADNDGSGLEFYGDPSAGVCVRNNNLTGNGDFGLSASETVLFDENQSCAAGPSPGYASGNNHFDNVGGACGGSSCSSCGCLPEEFWAFNADPIYRSVELGDSDFYCLGLSSALIDGGDELAYDLNGEASGRFNGDAPDIGARETGPGDCD